MAGDRWRRLGRTTEYSNPFLSVLKEVHRTPGDERAEYYQVDVADGVIVVGEVEGSLVLVEHERPRFGRAFLEFPAGGVGSDESVREAALREFREETGYDASDPEILGSYHVSVWESAKHHVVWVDDVERPDSGDSRRESTDEEIVAVRELPAETVLEEVESNPGVQWVLTPVLLARHRGRL